MAVWDTARVKSQLRLTAQRLGQIQYKLDSQGQITRRDIATLLQQGNVSLARAKAQKTIRDDIYGDLLQTLEMHVGVVLQHFGEFERSEPPSPVVVEAASSIIYAAPHTDSRDLQIVRDLLIQRLGPDFARSATDNRDGYVSARTARDLSSRPPTASALDAFLLDIAKTHNVSWTPDWQPHQKVDAISAMLDPSSIPTVDLPYLRHLCSHGLPEYPPWLRPKVWRLLLGTLPAKKAIWNDDARKQRDSYYDLVRRLLEAFTNAPPPTRPLSPTDAALVAASKELTQVPRALFTKLEEEPEAYELCPLDDSAPEDIKISFANALDERLRLIREFEAESDPSSPAHNMPEIRLEETPEIRLEVSEEDSPESQRDTSEETNEETREGLLDSSGSGAITPEISLSAPDSPTSVNSGPPTTLVPSRVYNAFGANPKHETALIRLLFIHSSLNPAQRAPQVASLLVSMYSALVDEVVVEDASHIEADAFWLFEAFVSEFAELEDTEGAHAWMGKLGQRISAADAELTEDLQAKNLDPALPHYSYRWLTTILTHTLPLPAVLSTWDALFSQPSRERDSNPKLDYLVDVCVSMLVCARGPLFRLGKRPTKPLNLWGESTSALMNEPLSDREIDEAFIQGMALLQKFPLEDVGGIERVLQLAFDLAAERERDQQAAAARAASGGLGARLRNSVWRSAAVASTPPPTPPPVPAKQQQQHDSDSDSDSDSDTDPEDQTIQVHPPATPDQSTFAARLASNVWKGITNQSAMEPPPTPTSPSPWSSPVPPPPVFVQPEAASTPSPSRSSFESASSSTGASRASAIWGYAEKLRDSDAAAKISKASTNWKFKALDVWNNRAAAIAPNTAPLSGGSSLSPDWVPSTPANRNYGPQNDRRSSLPVDGSDHYSPPARPAFFRPPRDSMIVDTRRDSLLSPTGSDFSAHSEGDIDRLKRTSMSPHTPSPRSAGTRSGGPRPLLLNSSSLITHTRSPTLPTNGLDSKFADAVRAKRPTVSHKTSQSSISSLSPSEHAFMARSRTAEISSRVVPLNRRSVSPMPGARMRRQESMSSTTSSPAFADRQLPPEAFAEYDALRRKPGWKSADAARDSMTTTSSIPSPPFSADAAESNNAVRVVSAESQRGSVVLGEFGELDAPLSVEHTPKISRKAHIGLSRLQLDDSSDSSAPNQVPSRASRVRSKRQPPRLNTLRTRESRTSPVGDREHSPNSLAAEWPEEPDATTPKAASFEAAGATMPPRRTRKVSSEGRRKNAESTTPVRTRKVSSEGRDPKKRVRDSAAVEGDDEGYDELLSAYESEDSAAR